MDARYKTIKKLLQRKVITDFDELFEHIPKTVIGNDIKADNRRMNMLMTKPEEITMREMLALAKLVEVDLDEIMSVVYNACKKCESDNK